MDRGVHDKGIGAMLKEELRALIADLRQAAGSEIAWQKARVALAGKYAGRIAIFAFLALMLVFFSLMALVVGALLALSSVLGTWGATGAVVGALLAMAVFTSFMARLGLRRLRRLFSHRKG